MVLSAMKILSRVGGRGSGGPIGAAGRGPDRDRLHNLRLNRRTQGADMRLYPAMGSNQIRCGRLLIAVGLAVLLGACSDLHGVRQPAAAPRNSASAPQAASAPQGAAPAVAPAPPAAAASAATESAPIIRASAPMTYTVKRGDTLWGIASKFLRNPWDWPEVWYINPKIRNPHWIYPGDVLALAYGRNGKPMIRVLKPSPLRSQEPAVRLEPHLRSTPITAAIPTIPYSAIAAFLMRPVVFSASQIDHAPHVIAFRGKHQVAGSGFVVYVSSLGHDPHSHYSVIHVGEKLRAPGDLGFGHVYGYLGIYTATAAVTADGDPATAVLTHSARETLPGDRLIANDPQLPLTMEPRAPSGPVHGQIIWVVGGTGGADLAGTYDVVVLDRGSREGLVPGDVLAVEHRGRLVHDTHGSFGWLGGFSPRVKLPNYRAGTVLVFKTYRNISFALVVAAAHTIENGDVVRNP